MHELPQPEDIFCRPTQNNCYKPHIHKLFNSIGHGKTVTACQLAPVHHIREPFKAWAYRVNMPLILSLWETCSLIVNDCMHNVQPYISLKAQIYQPVLCVCCCFGTDAVKPIAMMHCRHHNTAQLVSCCTDCFGAHSYPITVNAGGWYGFGLWKLPFPPCHVWSWSNSCVYPVGVSGPLMTASVLLARLPKPWSMLP